jgi:ABC-type transport system involved in multi-copper enzyme maturation permease subunit
MRTTAFSPARVGWIARNTMIEAMRQRLFVFGVVLAVLLVGGVRFLGEFNFGASELKFIADFGFGALTFFGSVLAIVVTAQLFFSELENRTALTILAKPVHRSEFVLGKFVGTFAVLFVFVGLVGAALVLVLWMRERALLGADPEALAPGRLVPYAGVLEFIALQWLKFGVISAYTMLLASFARTSLFAIATAFLVLVICHLQHLAAEAWTRFGAGVARLAAAALALVFPNFQLFNIGDLVASGRPVPWAVTGAIAGYAGIYLIVLLGLAVFSFRRREI